MKDLSSGLSGDTRLLRTLNISAHTTERNAARFLLFEVIEFTMKFNCSSLSLYCRHSFVRGSNSPILPSKVAILVAKYVVAVGSLLIISRLTLNKKTITQNK